MLPLKHTSHLKVLASNVFESLRKLGFTVEAFSIPGFHSLHLGFLIFSSQRCSTFLMPSFLYLCYVQLKAQVFLVASLNFSNKFLHNDSLLPLMTGAYYFRIGTVLKSWLVPVWCFIFQVFLAFVCFLYKMPVQFSILLLICLQHPIFFPFDRTFVSSKIRKAKTAPVITVGNSTLTLWPLAFSFLSSSDREFLLVGLYVATVSTDAVSVTSVIRNSTLASGV